MYTYVRGIVRWATGPTGYKPYDVSNIPLNVFYKYFKEALIVIEDSLYQTKVAIKFQDYQAVFGSYTGTIQQWLDDNTNNPLITYSEYPSDVYRSATLHDIQYEWFTLLPGDLRKSSADQDKIRVGNGPDIRVHKTDNSSVDYNKLNACTLWLVNNHFVRHITDGTDIYLINAGKHYAVNSRTHACCINFNGIGTIQTAPILKDDIHYTIDGSSPHVKVKTTMDLNNQTVWMVIGGRLYMDDVVRVTGDNTVTLNVTQVDWFDKIFTSRNFIDLTNVIGSEAKMVASDFFSNEAFFTNLLTDPSSFFVLIDNTTLVVSLIPTTEYLYPFTYHTERIEKLPLLLNNGLMPKYFTRKFNNRRLLDIDAGTHKRYVYPSAGSNNGGGIFHGEINLGFPERYNRGYLLEIKALV